MIGNEDLASQQRPRRTEQRRANQLRHPGPGIGGRNDVASHLAAGMLDDDSMRRVLVKDGSTILLGGFGIHEFYLGKIGQGILYLLFCWTFIPAVIGFIEGILYLAMTDQEFNRKYGA